MTRAAVYTGNFDRRKCRLLRAYQTTFAVYRATPVTDTATIVQLVDRSNAINLAYRRLTMGLINERSQP